MNSHDLHNKILIVDDQPPNLLVVTLMLEELGYQFDTAVNGLDGVNRFVHSDYSLVLMDIEMPILDGYEACKRIRAFEKEHSRAQTPIIIITANPLPDVTAKTLGLDIARIIQKPFIFEALAANIAASIPAITAG